MPKKHDKQNALYRKDTLQKQTRHKKDTIDKGHYTKKKYCKKAQ